MSKNRNKNRVVHMVTLAVASMLLVAGCQQAQEPAAPVLSQIEVTEIEWALELPEGVTGKAGEITFVVTNGGNLEHNFVIEGVDEAIEVILPQDTQTLTVALDPGTYMLVCGLPGHQEAGMETEFTVSP